MHPAMISVRNMICQRFVLAIDSGPICAFLGQSPVVVDVQYFVEYAPREEHVLHGFALLKVDQ